LCPRKVISFNSVLSFKYQFWILLERASTFSHPENTEPEFVNVSGAQASIPPGWELIHGLLERLTLGALLFLPRKNSFLQTFTKVNFK
jgi:hypothetical protein